MGKTCFQISPFPPHPNTYLREVGFQQKTEAHSQRHIHQHVVVRDSGAQRMLRHPKGIKIPSVIELYFPITDTSCSWTDVRVHRKSYPPRWK